MGATDGPRSLEPKSAVDKVHKTLDKLDTDELDEHVKNAQAMIARGEEPKRTAGGRRTRPTEYSSDEWAGAKTKLDADYSGKAEWADFKARWAKACPGS